MITVKSMESATCQPILRYLLIASSTSAARIQITPPLPSVDMNVRIRSMIG